MLRWPIREVLRAYLHELRQAALEQWRFEQLRWAAVAPYSKAEPPGLPGILREDDHGNATN